MNFCLFGVGLAFGIQFAGCQVCEANAVDCEDGEFGIHSGSAKSVTEDAPAWTPATKGGEEELLHFRMLQVSADLVPRQSTLDAIGEKDLRQRDHKDKPAVRQSMFQQLQLFQGSGYSIESLQLLLPFAIAILLPHVVSFFTAYLLLSGRGNVQASNEILQEKQEGPKSLMYIVERVGPMWLIHMLGIFSFSVGAPSIEYLYLNYFARQQSHLEIDCSVQMAEAPCAESVMRVLRLQIIRGFAQPLVQFFVGPALGAISDSFGRKPAVLVIRGCLLISCTGAAAVAWFPVPIWIDFGLSFFAMIPWGAVPFAWYIDRLDHGPSIVYAISMIEGSCIVCAALGTALGSLLSMKMAILVEFIGRVITMWIAIFLLPESLDVKKRMPFSWSSLMPTAALQVLFQSPVVEKLSAIGVINTFHWAGYYVIFEKFLQAHMAWTREDTYIGGLAEQISQVLWLTLGVKVLLRIFGQAGLMAVSTSACVLSNIGQMLSSTPWQIYAQNIALSGPAIMGNAVVAGIVGKAASPAQQGMLQSALGLVTQVAAALGPVAFATVYRLLDPTAPGSTSWNMYLYIFYGALFAVPSLLLTFSLNKHSEIGIPEKADG